MTCAHVPSKKLQAFVFIVIAVRASMFNNTFCCVQKTQFLKVVLCRDCIHICPVLSCRRCSLLHSNNSSHCLNDNSGTKAACLIVSVFWLFYDFLFQYIAIRSRKALFLVDFSVLFTSIKMIR